MARVRDATYLHRAKNEPVVEHDVLGRPIHKTYVTRNPTRAFALSRSASRPLRPT